MTIHRRLRRTMLATIIGVIAAACSAYAVWTASGAGQGSGTTGTVTSVVLSPGSPTAGLYPGGHTNVVLSVSNPNASAVRIGSFALATDQGSAGFAVDSGHAGCGLTALSLSTQTNGSTGWTVPGKLSGVNGILAVTLTNALTMSLNAANACQGATTTVYLAAGP